MSSARARAVAAHFRQLGRKLLSKSRLSSALIPPSLTQAYRRGHSLVVVGRWCGVSIDGRRNARVGVATGIWTTGVGRRVEREIELSGGLSSGDGRHCPLIAYQPYLMRDLMRATNTAGMSKYYASNI